MARRISKGPPHIMRLVEALREVIPRAQINLEWLRRRRYRFVVVSSKFERMDHPERQRLVWDLAGQVVPGEQIFEVGMIITIGRREFASYAHVLSQGR